jgi:site-specific DNA-methyltransferase (adenine-specific)
MGKTWDSSGIAYSVELWRECLRVLKPGGHLLAFGGTRTWHRLAVAIEDAGFEIRDNIAWLYGSGFPKSHNISKAIDKDAGAERQVIGTRKVTSSDLGQNSGWNSLDTSSGVYQYTAASSDDAKAWDGWGTALKPAHEPIVVARKPLIGTVAENVLEWGVGGINIDATRIGEGHGRWPANIILDEYTAKLLDEQSGISKPKPGRTGEVGGQQGLYENGHKADYVSTWVEDFGGGASRFFYVAKANKKDRNEGLEDLVAQESAGKGNGLGRLCAICGASILKPCECPDRTFVNPPKQNFHPTVKPTALMQYLVRLVTPENGIVLDPFTGSGSTGKAAILEGKHFIGIELTPEYLPIIEGRLTHAYKTLDSKEDLF